MMNFKNTSHLTDFLFIPIMNIFIYNYDWLYRNSQEKDKDWIDSYILNYCSRFVQVVSDPDY